MGFPETVPLWLRGLSRFVWDVLEVNRPLVLSWWPLRRHHRSQAMLCPDQEPAAVLIDPRSDDILISLLHECRHLTRPDDGEEAVAEWAQTFGRLLRERGILDRLGLTRYGCAVPA